jgi:hypothetical protein
MNLQEYIKELMDTDDEYKTKYDFVVKNRYLLADGTTKNTINDIFMYLTGFQFETIIKNFDEKEVE